MAASNKTENQIIDDAYFILEQDSDAWDTDSDEYATARGFLNLALHRWEDYNNTVWPELWGTLDDAADGDKTLSASTHDYDCPSNFSRPSSWVRTVDSSNNKTYWKVIPAAKSAGYSNSTDLVCWFTGDKKNGFVLHFNPNVTLTAGEGIDYEYYKKVTETTAPTDQVEISNPNYLSYSIAAHMAEDGLDPTLFNISEQLLDNMETAAMGSLEGIEDSVDSDLESGDGFGY